MKRTIWLVAGVWVVLLFGGAVIAIVAGALAVEGDDDA